MFRWIALGIAVPVATFVITLYAPTFPKGHWGLHLALGARLPSLPSSSNSLFSQFQKSTSKFAGTLSKGTLELPPLPEGGVDLDNPNSQVVIDTAKLNGTNVDFLIGGVAGTYRSPIREGVDDMVTKAAAIGGLNGTFFANASLEGTDNLLIGPSLAPGDAEVVVSPYDKKPSLLGRPLVLMSSNHTRIVPYNPATMDDDVSLRSLLPRLSDAFLGGVWLVHNGIAVTKAGMAQYNVKDAMDPRRRSVFGLMPDGRPVLVATNDSLTSAQLARDLAQYGVQEAVLLDSGFSTCLVCQDKILVTGHSTRDIPSRPVPHGILIYGQLTPQAQSLYASCTSGVHFHDHPVDN